jgi:hypothetical protein
MSQKKSSDFAFVVKYQHQFVAGLKDVELSCTVVSGTGTDMIIPPQAPQQIQ